MLQAQLLQAPSASSISQGCISRCAHQTPRWQTSFQSPTFYFTQINVLSAMDCTRGQTSSAVAGVVHDREEISAELSDAAKDPSTFKKRGRGFTSLVQVGAGPFLSLNWCKKAEIARFSECPMPLLHGGRRCNPIDGSAGLVVPARSKAQWWEHRLFPQGWGFRLGVVSCTRTLGSACHLVAITAFAGGPGNSQPRKGGHSLGEGSAALRWGPQPHWELFAAPPGAFPGLSPQKTPSLPYPSTHGAIMSLQALPQILQPFGGQRF